MTTEVLSTRALNRATLARQFLLERSTGTAAATIEHLGGMQAQAPDAPYVGLWTRLRDFRHDELISLTERRDMVRVHVMRCTIHLLTARDCLAVRPLFGDLLASRWGQQRVRPRRRRRGRRRAVRAGPQAARGAATHP